MTIMIVEDTVGGPMRMVLEKGGYEVVLAPDGEAAWRLLNTTRIDLFLIDWNLPGLSGIGLVWKLRHLPQHGRTPIIMISGRSSPEDVAHAMEAGVTRFVPKPVTAAQLRNLVRGVLPGSPDVPDATSLASTAGGASPPDAASGAQPCATPAATVLLVEDTVGAAMSKVLERFGYRVLLATDGEGAWATLSGERIDLFLVDWMLPRLSGIDLVRRIRQLPQYGQTPIVMISGRTSRQDIEEATRAGVTDYMAKPFTALQLRNRIRSILASSPDPRSERIHQLCRCQDTLQASAADPVVLFVEAVSDSRDLSRPENRVLTDFLLRAGQSIQAINDDHPDLRLRFCIDSHIGDVMNMLRRLHTRRRVKLVVVSLDSRGNPFLLVRLLTAQRHGSVPVVLLCDAVGAIPPRQLSLIEQMGVDLYERRELDGAGLRQLIEDHVSATQEEVRERVSTPEEIRQRLLDELEVIGSLPTLPQVHRQIGRLAADPASSLEAWSRVIEVDPASSAVVVRRARSPAFGFTGDIGDVARAVTLLGKDAVRDLVTAEAVKRAFDAVQETGFDLAAFWAHSIAVGVAAQVLALPLDEAQWTGSQRQEFQSCRFDDRQVAFLKRIDLPVRLRLEPLVQPFTSGLLHDIGKVVMAQAYPGLYPLIVEELQQQDWSIPMTVAEQAVSDLTHAQIGGILTGTWELGDDLYTAVLHHHDPAPDDPHAFLVGVADVVGQVLYPFPASARGPLATALERGDLDAALPFLPAGFSEQSYLTWEELCELLAVVAPALRRRTDDMRAVVGRG